MKENIIIFSTLIIFVVSCTIQTPPNYYIKTSVSPKNSQNYNENLKVAVISENIDSWFVSSVTHRVLITELMDVGFTVIERNNLEKILDEQKLTSSGLIDRDDDKEKEEKSLERDFYFLDKNSINEIGKMLGVSKLIMVYVVPNIRFKVNLCTIRLVDVFSGEVETSTTIHAPLSGKDIDLLMKQVAHDMMHAYKHGQGIIRNKLSTKIPTKSNTAGTLDVSGDKDNNFRKKIDNK